MKTGEIKIGGKVKSLRDFSGVKAGTFGIIIEDYGSGITIGWDRPENPYPKNKTPEEVAAMWAVNSDCPLRDGFDKQTELEFLKICE